MAAILAAILDLEQRGTFYLRSEGFISLAYLELYLMSLCMILRKIWPFEVFGCHIGGHVESSPQGSFYLKSIGFISFLTPKNLYLELYFMSLCMILTKIWSFEVYGSHLGGHLGYFKMLKVKKFLNHQNMSTMP